MKAKMLRAHVDGMRKPHPDQRSIDAESVALLLATAKPWATSKRAAWRNRLKSTKTS
ncbi:MAG: hypothetical protein PVF70_01015 [Anaerolineales bacterium]|jgi:hypothetical protein